MNLEAHQRTALSDYREFPVPTRLADYFLCLWTQAIVGSREYAHRVLPDACVDIVFVNDDPPVVVGPWTEPFVVRLAAGTKIVGARLHPGHAPGLLGMPAAELLNQSALLSDVWGQNRARFAPVLDLARSTSRRSGLAETLDRATGLAAKPDPVVAASIRWLARHSYGRVEQLSKWIGMSHRQLQRRFVAAVGYGPKIFQSVLRFQRLLNFASEPGTQHSFADLAAISGYADQAHMTREARRFANCTPTILLRSAECTLRMSDLFKTDQPDPNYP
jgi:AraC-like DNA-binding protein